MNPVTNPIILFECSSELEMFDFVFSRVYRKVLEVSRMFWKTPEGAMGCHLVMDQSGAALHGPLGPLVGGAPFALGGKPPLAARVWEGGAPLGGAANPRWGRTPWGSPLPKSDTLPWPIINREGQPPPDASDSARRLPHLSLSHMNSSCAVRLLLHHL